MFLSFNTVLFISSSLHMNNLGHIFISLVIIHSKKTGLNILDDLSGDTLGTGIIRDMFCFMVIMAKHVVIHSEVYQCWRGDANSK